MRETKSAELEKHEIECLKAIANISCVGDIECFKCPLGVKINGVVECIRNLNEICLVVNKINPHERSENEQNN